MTNAVISEYDLAHLADQFQNARPILFTGAGFSLAAKNLTGNRCPSFDDIKAKLWEMCFPGKTIDPESTVQDLYDIALGQHKRNLTEYLRSSFSIDASSLPHWYCDILNFPWYKSYTLNIDDTEVATSRQYSLSRSIAPVSATSQAMSHALTFSHGTHLQFIHLNGMLVDAPDYTTFSLTQYADRIAQSDPWYMTLSTELLCYPIVFIGTKLNEPPLWQHIEMRKFKGGRESSELRPRSYLVIPHLDAAKKGLLAKFNVVHIPLTAEEFVKEIQNKIGDSLARGTQLLKESAVSGSPVAHDLLYVHELAKDLTKKTDYLLGEPPTWSDIHSGRAIPRGIDEEIWSKANTMYLSADLKGIIAITGTAGSGQSTSLMRLAMKFNSLGKRVAWVDEDSEVSLRDIKRAFTQPDAPDILAIDDADVYGNALPSLLKELAVVDSHPIILIAIRSGRIDRFISPSQLTGLPYHEMVMPPLVDGDISALVTVLDNENRLGILKNKPRDQQERAFRDQAGRILIVGMIQATSGKLFKDKLIEEYDQLEGLSKRIYSLLAITTYFRFGLSKEDILIGIRDSSNQVLNALEELRKRHLLSLGGSVEPLYRILHRLIADIIFEKLATSGILYQNILSIGLICATKITPEMSIHAKPRRLLRRIINHDFLLKNVGLEQAREIYGTLENYTTLTDDFHYWLQRGSLEVEADALDAAENFLNQARALDAGNYILSTEYAYLLFKKAIETPGSHIAHDLVDEATKILRANIISHGTTDPYPYHIYGSQGLAWSRRGISLPDRKEAYLKKIKEIVQQGRENHPRNQDLKNLLDDITREYLKLSTV